MLKNGNGEVALKSVVTNFVNGKIRLDDLHKAYRLSGIYYREADEVNSYMDRAFKEVLLEKYVDPERFKRAIASAIVVNQDNILKKLLKGNSAMIDQITDHREILNLAVMHKATYTFDILISHGFDPTRGDSKSPIALAAYDQGQQQLQHYCGAISEKYGIETVIQLINEKDNKGLNALGSAIAGKSYAKTIEFLISQGADYKCNFRHNLEHAIEGHHNQTFTILFNKNKDGLAQDLTAEYFDALSETATISRNNSAQLLLLSAMRQVKKIAPNAEVVSKIATKATQSDYSMADLYEVCRAGNKDDFDFLTSGTSPDVLEGALAGFDSEGKSPLFYAIDGNCYSTLVETLLDAGADPIRLIDSSSQHYRNHKFELSRRSDGEAIDALSLCVHKKEPDTFGLILRHESLTQMDGVNLLGIIAHEISVSDSLNALVIEQFFKNVSTEKLNEMRDRRTRGYFKLAVKNGLLFAPEATADKIKECFADDVTGMVEFLNNIKDSSSVWQAEGINNNIDRYFPDLKKENNAIDLVTAIPLTEKDRLLSTNPAYYGTSNGNNDNGIDTPNNSFCSTVSKALTDCFGYITRSNR